MSQAPSPVPAPVTAQTSAPSAAAGTPTAKPAVSFEDFAKLDLRVARVVKAEDHPKADKLFRLQLDDGSGTPRQICAGIKGHYRAEDLVGRLIIIVANLEPRVLRGEESRGMLLAASNMPKDAATVGGAVPAERRVIILRPDSDIDPGAIVS